MPVTLEKTISTVCRRSRVVSERCWVVERTTATRPFSGALMRSTVMFTSPDQSREKRTSTAQPSTRRLAWSSGRTQTKYQRELVISLPTVFDSGFTDSPASLSSVEGVRVSRAAGVRSASYPSTSPEKMPERSV